MIPKYEVSVRDQHECLREQIRAFITTYYADSALYVAHPEKTSAFPWDEEIPDEVKGFSDFIRKLPMKNEEDCIPSDEYEMMLEYLRDRGVNGLTKADIETRPEIIVRCFVGFHTLSVKPEFPAENNSVSMLFLKTFSQEPIPDELCKNVLSKEEHLKEILEKRFSVKRPELRQVIEDIEKKYQYDIEKIKTDHTEKMRVSDLVVQFVKEYCRGSKAEFNTGDFEEYEVEFRKLGIVQLTYDKNNKPAYRIKCEIPEKSGNENLDRFVERFKPKSK